MGKSLQEGLGEVQEMIDICDFAVGLSRQLHGLQCTQKDRTIECMNSGTLLVSSVSFLHLTFPVAVWSWNSMIAAVCGDVSIWKPSEKTPLSAVACFNIMTDVLKDNNIPEGVFNLIIGDVETVGKPMSEDRRIPLVSATGSTRMGKEVAKVVGARLGKEYFRTWRQQCYHPI